jgi:hypothetical protein
VVAEIDNGVRLRSTFEGRTSIVASLCVSLFKLSDADDRDSWTGTRNSGSAVGKDVDGKEK